MDEIKSSKLQNMTIYFDEENYPISDALGFLTDEEIESGQYCDQTVIDLKYALITALKELRFKDDIKLVKDDIKLVRVDFFKESGKWYTMEDVQVYKYAEKDFGLTESFAKSLRDHFEKTYNCNIKRLSEMTAVCLYPYYDKSFPVMIKNGDWLNY